MLIMHGEQYGGVTMMQRSNIAYGLLQHLAEIAWDQGRVAEAQRMSAWVDAAMLEDLRQGEGRQVGTDEVPLILAADGAENRRLAAGVDMPAVQAEPCAVPAAGKQGVVL